MTRVYLSRPSGDRSPCQCAHGRAAVDSCIPWQACQPAIDTMNATERMDRGEGTTGREGDVVLESPSRYWRVIRINRPEALNALTTSILRAARGVYDELEAVECGAVLLEGAG